VRVIVHVLSTRYLTAFFMQASICAFASAIYLTIVGRLLQPACALKDAH
jgi:hypothetical protein